MAAPLPFFEEDFILLTANTTQFPNSMSVGRTGNLKNTEDNIHHTDAKTSRWENILLLKILISFSMVAIVTVACLNWEQLQLGKDLLRKGPWGESFAILMMIFLIINIPVFVWRVVLVLMYRATPPVYNDRLPVCTVVVPAYNEGKQVLTTLRSIANGDYPEDKMDIIVIDDGSIDDTWFWIKKAKKELGSRLKTIRLPRNSGKRHALHEGFKQSRGEVLITVDSDSIVDPQTLRCMVSPFVVNPSVGAVAGNVRVLNTREGVIPRMLDVSFLFSFDFLRASQSMVDTVICTPGALSAYRKDVVLKVLPTWLGQKFFGKPANIGEDRAMTNLILRQGYSVHYQKNATVYTNVPVRYKNLCKMFIRWARSNIRENLVMGTFIFTRFRKKISNRRPNQLCASVLNHGQVAVSHGRNAGMSLLQALRIRSEHAYGGIGLFNDFRGILLVALSEFGRVVGLRLWIFLDGRPFLDFHLCPDNTASDRMAHPSKREKGESI